jgi:hypothetical protein
MYNTVAKAFETVSLDPWKIKEEEKEINRNKRTYYTYSYTGDERSEVKLKVEF